MWYCHRTFNVHYLFSAQYFCSSFVFFVCLFVTGNHSFNMWVFAVGKVSNSSIARMLSNLCLYMPLLQNLSGLFVRGICMHVIIVPSNIKRSQVLLQARLTLIWMDSLMNVEKKNKKFRNEKERSAIEGDKTINLSLTG